MKLEHQGALTFVIPVQHPTNAKNWAGVKLRLAETLRSISNQEGGVWKGVVVANQGSDLPPMPQRCVVVWVDYPPNPLYIKAIVGTSNREELYEAFRFDKGRRVLAGLLATAPHDHIMIVDNDDFVSRHLARFVGSHPDAHGWVVLDGYFWDSGSRLLFRVSDFSSHCGTCHLVRSDLYRLPVSVESADAAYVRRMLGSHTSHFKEFESRGTTLAALPFSGAVYRIGHAESFIGSRSIIGRFFLKKGLSLGDRVRALRRLRLKTPSIEREFFGRK